MKEDLASTLSERPTENTGQWITVSERLPESGTGVIVALADAGDTDVEFGEIRGNGKWYLIGESYPLKHRSVTHWMPLPEPPDQTQGTQ